MFFNKDKAKKSIKFSEIPARDKKENSCRINKRSEQGTT